MSMFTGFYGSINVHDEMLGRMPDGDAFSILLLDHGSCL